MNCSEFLDAFSDYLDGSADPASCQEVEVHLTSCASCRRYESAYRQGRKLLESFPEVEVSEDFHPRLQHRIYHVEDGDALVRSASGSAASAAAVLGIAIVLAAAAWAPLIQPDDPLVELSPIVVSQPRTPAFGLRPAPVSLASTSTDPETFQETVSLDLWAGSHLLLYQHSALSARYRRTPIRRAGIQ